MSKNLDQVLDAWSKGKPRGKHPDMRPRDFREPYAGLQGVRNPCWTDGKTVYSYAMPIAWRDEVGRVEVAKRETAFRPDGGGRGGISMTTRRHIDQINQWLRVHGPDPLVILANEHMIALEKEEKAHALAG